MSEFAGKKWRNGMGFYKGTDQPTVEYVEWLERELAAMQAENTKLREELKRREIEYDTMARKAGVIVLR